MLWIALILLALSILLCGAALADDSGSCGEDVTWTFHSATGEMTITGTGAMTDYANVSNVPWYSFRDSITSAVIVWKIFQIPTVSCGILCKINGSRITPAPIINAVPA